MIDKRSIEYSQVLLVGHLISRIRNLIVNLYMAYYLNDGLSKSITKICAGRINLGSPIFINYVTLITVACRHFLDILHQYLYTSCLGLYILVSLSYKLVKALTKL